MKNVVHPLRGCCDTILDFEYKLANPKRTCVHRSCDYPDNARNIPWRVYG
jgi:hypothetical protein